MKTARIPALLFALCVCASSQAPEKTVAPHEEVAWKWEKEPKWEDYAAKMDAGIYVLSYTKDPARTNLHEGTFRLTHLADKKEVAKWPGHERMPCFVTNGRLLVVDYSRFSAGGTVRALDIKTGKKIWEEQLAQTHPDAHSRYNSFTRAEVRDGALYIYSLQDAGRFVWVFRLDDGYLLAHALYRLGEHRMTTK